MQHIYNAALGLDGTIDQLIDWAYRYTDDYSDEALDEIARLARKLNVPDDKANIPLLCKKARERETRKDDTLPFELMKLDKIIYGKISYSETKSYGEVEVYDESESVLVCITGTDDGGSFVAAASVPMMCFMHAEDAFLEAFVWQAMYYNKVYSE